MSQKENDQLIPTIIQDYRSGEILMLAYMNKESLELTKKTGYTWFWSRSRQKLWNKGETSGNKQKVKKIFYDCDADTYLVLVDQIGGVACHTGNRSCFYRCLYEEPGFEGVEFDQLSEKSVFNQLFKVIEDRKSKLPDNSYTASLLKSGLSQILAKVKEELFETIEAAEKGKATDLVSEISDLIYHLFVLMAAKNVTIEDVERELKRRRENSLVEKS